MLGFRVGSGSIESGRLANGKARGEIDRVAPTP